MEITSLLALPHSNLASLQLELLAVPQVLLALQGFPFSTLRVKPNLSKNTQKPQLRDPHTLHCPCRLLLATPPAPIDSCTLFFCSLQVLSQLQDLGALCVTLLHMLFPLLGFWVWEYTDYTQS